MFSCPQAEDWKANWALNNSFKSSFQFLGTTKCCFPPPRWCVKQQYMATHEIHHLQLEELKCSNILIVQ